MGTRLPKILYPSEIDAFVSVIENKRDRVIAFLMLDAGLRVSEVAHLKLPNIIWEEQRLKFVGKGKKEAEIPITSRLRDTLEAAIKSRPPQATHEYLIWDKKNPSKPISRFAIHKLIKNYGKKAGITRPVHPHMLRHTFATELYKATQDPLKVQKGLRHSHLKTVLIYTHLSVDELRKSTEAIDRRPLLVRLWSRLKPNIIPDLLKPKLRAFYIGETLGREKEISASRTAFKDRRNTIYVGDEGVGKKHLLKGLFEEKKKAGEKVYQLDEFSPARAALVALCEQLKEDSIIGEVPKGRTSKPFIDAIRNASKSEKITLFILSLNDITKSEIRVLRRLAECCVIFSSINPYNKTRLKEIFFGNYHEILIEGFGKNTTFEFASRMTVDMNIPDKAAYLKYIYVESKGNPKAIIELVNATKSSGNTAPQHLGVQKVLPATPILSLFLMAAIASRYSATALSQPDWKIFATIIILGIAPLLVLDKILKTRRK